MNTTQHAGDWVGCQLLGQWRRCLAGSAHCLTEWRTPTILTGSRALEITFFSLMRQISRWRQTHRGAFRLDPVHVCWDAAVLMACAADWGGLNSNSRSVVFKRVTGWIKWGNYPLNRLHFTSLLQKTRLAVSQLCCLNDCLILLIDRGSDCWVFHRKT